MSAGSSIEWTEATWNPIAGCTPISPGCLNCYAAVMARRLEAMGQKKYIGVSIRRNGRDTFNGTINYDEDALDAPLRRKKPTMYFVNSMSDLFHEAVPFEFIEKVYDVMLQCEHTFQILTKRTKRMAEFVHRFLHPALLPTVLENIWHGTSAENQETFDARRPYLFATQAPIRFLSLEPLLGPIDLGFARGNRIEWVIVGGESGANARPCYTNWIDSIVAQCKLASVPVFVKQLGSNHRCDDAEFGDMPIKLQDSKGGDINEFPADLRIRQMPEVASVPA